MQVWSCQSTESPHSRASTPLGLSFSPTIRNINLVRSLTNRAIRICSPSLVGKELQSLRSIFLANGYPGQVLDRLITLTPQARPFGPIKCPLFVRIPWLGEATESLVQRAKVAVGLAYFSGEVRAACQKKKKKKKGQT